MRLTYRHAILYMALICVAFATHAQENCCEAAYQAARTEPGWKFKSNDERKCAETEAEKALAADKKKLAAQCLLALADDAVERNRFESTFNYLEMLQNALPVNDPEYEPYLANSYGLRAYIHDQQRYQKLAVENYRKAIDLYKIYQMKDEQFVEEANLVKLLAQQGNYDDAIALGEATWEEARNCPDAGRGIELKATIVNNLAFAYQHQALNYRADMRTAKMNEAGNKALELFKENLPRAQKLPSQYWQALSNTISASVFLKQADTARHYMNLLNTIGGLPPPILAQSAITHLRQGNHDDALAEIVQACRSVSLTVSPSDSLGPVELNMPVSAVWLPINQYKMNVLENKGALLAMYDSLYPSGNLFLEKSLVAHEQAVEVFNRMQFDLYVDADVMSMRTRLSSAYLSAAHRAAQLFLRTDASDTFKRNMYWSKAYLYAEQARGFLLRQGILSASEAECNPENASAHCRDKVFRDALFLARKQGKSPKEKKIREEHLQFVDSLKNSSDPADRAYYERRYGHGVPDIAEVQSRLLPDRSLFIEYVWSTPHPFALWATPNSKGLVMLDIGDSDRFWADVARFQENWLREDEDKLDMALGYHLYETLLLSVFNDLPATEKGNIERLVIVADNLLRTVPFDVLPMSETKKGQVIPYVLEKYIVGYQYSAALWMLQKQMVAPKMAKQVALGVFVNARDQTGCSSDTLRYLDQFVDTDLAITIKKAGATQKNFQRASKGDFEQHGKQFDLLLFAMHSCVGKDPDMSYLSFNEEVRVSDLYSYKQPLKALLTVFGSCETAKQGGEHEAGTKGEGVIGLHWAISYAGCPNVVATLNKVVDKNSAVLMDNFYNNLLLQKMPTDEALAVAKRNYLKVSADPKKGYLGHPKYWANFICIGPPVQFE